MDWTRGRTIGNGSTATVSLATYLSSGDVFAVKSAEIAQSEFLQREQKILSSVTSPYIVGYRGCDISRENNKFMYNLLLEYVPGGTLTDVIPACGGQLDEHTIRHYTWQILKGLEYLHSIGLAHCDIKGRNILIGESGAKIADFGCAKRLDPEETATATISGTPMFMAPEAARGEEQGYASDIWSLGCTIIEMATGGAPWPDADDPISVIYRVGYSGHQPDFPGFLSNQARDFLGKCLRRDPKERWTAKQLLNHPFLGGGEFISKPIKRASNSPTSTLDQDFWNFFDDESRSLGNLALISDHHSSADERIGRLALISEGPNWGFDDQNWITVRGDCMVDDDEDDVNSGLVKKQESYYAGGTLMDSLSSNIIGGRRSGDFCGGCKYEKDSFVIRNLSLRGIKICH